MSDSVEGCKHKETETLQKISGEDYQIWVIYTKCKKCKQITYSECGTNLSSFGGRARLVDLTKQVKSGGQSTS